VKGLRALENILLCRTAARAATFSKSILWFFEICGPACGRQANDGGVRDIGLKISSA
jgi:hypothetical protein